MKKNYAIVPKMMMRNPLLAMTVARAIFSNFKAINFDYRFYKGRSKELSLVTFRITPLCNLRCVMCGQWGKTGVYHSIPVAEELKKLVTIEQYRKLVDELSGVNPILYVWGGEPFLYPDFMELARYMAEKCPAFCINTNGTYLEKNAGQIVKDQWGGIFVSLDGFEEVNDSIRGRGSYQRVIQGIQAVNREKEHQKSSLPYIGIVTAISNMNYLTLEEFVDSLKDLNLSWHIINLGTYVNHDLGIKHREFMKKHFQVDARWWEGIANGCNEGIDGKRFAEILERVQKKDYGYPIITQPVIKAKKMEVYYSSLETLVRKQCNSPWSCVNIDYNGDVHFCCDYPDYVIGNIKKEGFFDIYNNDKAVHFRQTLKDAPEGIFPMCTRCYQLMLSGRPL